MKKKQETGYAKNYANLEDLISVCKEFGPTYNPKKECLTINGLINTHEAAAEIMKETRDSKVNRDLFTINRSKGYSAMKHLMIRAAHAFEVSGAGKELVADAKGILRKINGRRAVPIKTNDNGKPQSAEPPSAEIPAATGTTGVETKTISVSQQGYDDMMGHFEKMLALVSSNSSFEANEPELQFEALQKSMEELKAI
jgi:hypothetical protein